MITNINKYATNLSISIAGLSSGGSCTSWQFQCEWHDEGEIVSFALALILACIVIFDGLKDNGGLQISLLDNDKTGQPISE